MAVKKSLANISVTEVLNAGCENEMVIAGYKRSKLRLFLSWIVIVLSGGMIFILLTWKDSLSLKARFKPCSLKNAEKILLKDEHGQEFVEVIKYGKKQKERYFENKKLKYVWNAQDECFERLRGLDQNTPCSYFHMKISGLDSATVNADLDYYGQNSIVVEVKPILHLLRHEALNPFYIFQMYTVILWSIQLYYYFAIGILVLSAISIIVTVAETRKQSQALHDAVETESEIAVIRDNTEVIVSSPSLVPGDIITIPKRNYVLECDAVLVSGQCIVDESTLTGESVPVTKNPIPSDCQDLFRVDVHKYHLLFSGTKVLQTRSSGSDKAKAVVLRTGFSTTKGELVRSILYPKPLNMKFYTDFLKFFVIFLILGLIAVMYSGIIWTVNNATVMETVLNSLDILTFVVPPILPAAYSSVVALAHRRLKKQGIYSLSSKYINMCGGLDVVCFDKTGTLTEDSLDLKAVLPTVDARFVSVLDDPTHLPMNSPLLHAMATCHNLTLIDGQLSGYPLDIRIFEAIDWALDESERVLQEECNCSPFLASPRHQTKENYFVILKQFPFESSAQRTTVICRQSKSSQYHVYVKGAPEKIVSLCSSKTVPNEFEDIFRQHAEQGFRVIAAAWRPLQEHVLWSEVEKMNRSDLEYGLEFLGLIILQNNLKAETTSVLRLLNNVDIRTIMVTGDNLSTAICIARECEMVQNNDSVIIVEAKRTTLSNETINLSFNYAKSLNYDIKRGQSYWNVVELLGKGYHFAIDGNSYNLLRHYDLQFLKRIIHQGTIFARMLPEQKMHLVETLQELGHQVGMCGDGANDCGALKSAHAGVALCMAEASVAAPFTSKKPNISCIPKLIREGRASLVSCLGIFKFQVAYCFSQLFMALILFYDSVKPTDPQYIFIDMILSVIPGLTFGNVGAYKHLVKEKPVKKLLAILPLVSIFSFLIFQVITYIITWNYYHSQTWFIPYKFVPGTPIKPSYEGTSLFTVSCFSYLLAAVVFSQGPPYRKPLYTNGLLLMFLLGAFIMCSFLTLYPGEVLRNWLSLKQAPSFYFHLVLYGIALVNCLFCHIWENYVIGVIVAKFVIPRIHCYFGPFELHEHLEKELKDDVDWPPINTTLKLDATLPQIPGVEQKSHLLQ